MNILIVDDHEGILEILTTMLEEMGHTVQSAINGEDAIYKLTFSVCKIDVIISDLDMPKMSGIDFYKQIKANFQILPPFILFTADIEAKRYQYLGFHAIIYKPNFQTLRDCVLDLEKKL